MKKFKVFASYITYCTAEVEAEDEDQAYDIARGVDGGQFIPSKECFDWNISQVTEIKETA
jgi:hypothetical protein